MKLAVWLLFSSTLMAAVPSPEREPELRRLLAHDCGACHGLRRLGGLGPALTPAQLATQSDDALVATILWGRPGTAMPPWRDFLSHDEALWLVAQLRQEPK